jgi:hypothetical protein
MPELPWALRTISLFDPFNESFLVLEEQRESSVQQQQQQQQPQQQQLLHTSHEQYSDSHSGSSASGAGEGNSMV